MGSLAKLTSVRRAALAAGTGRYPDPFAITSEGWMLRSAGGMPITPELAMTLSYVYSAVDVASGDFGTCPCQLFEDMGDEGKRRVQFKDAGIGALAYQVRWQPNPVQSAKAFWSTLAWQYLLRPAAFAEIIYRPGSDSMVSAIWPRHPDRVRQVILSNGTVAFELTGEKGGPRYLTSAEMLVVRNTSTDGLNAIGRIEYGNRMLASALALQDFTSNYFKKGATAALLATYKGAEMDDDEETRLHASLTRYVGGSENAGGILLVPEDIVVSSLGVEPEKAQLLGLKEYSGRDIARLFKIPPHKLAIAGTQTYASQVQSAQDYVTTCQMPMIREFQDAIYIHLINAREYYAKFNTAHLLQADQKTRMEAHAIAIASRIKYPSECRVEEDMSPDENLDRLSAMDHRPGDSKQNGNTGTKDQSATTAKSLPVRAILAFHDNAVRVLRREKAAVAKLAARHASASEVDNWRNGVKAFYEDHAQFVAETMRIPMAMARAYAAQHGAELEANGFGLMTEQWERLEAESLVELAVEPEAIGRLIAA